MFTRLFSLRGKDMKFRLFAFLPAAAGSPTRFGPLRRAPPAMRSAAIRPFAVQSAGFSFRNEGAEVVKIRPAISDFSAFVAKIRRTGSEMDASRLDFATVVANGEALKPFQRQFCCFVVYPDNLS